MKIFQKFSLIVLVVLASNLDLLADTPGIGPNGDPCGGPYPPCPVPIGDHIDILFFLMIAFFGLFKAYQYTRKSALNS